MIQDPLEKVEDFVRAGADVLTVHVESCDDLRPVLARIASLENANDPERGIVRGVAVNPGTPVEALNQYLDDVEMICVLGVQPGVKGQSFIEETRDRFSKIKEVVAGFGKNILLCIDGGIKRDNIVEVAGMRPDLVVSGSAIYDGKAPLENARFMMSAVKVS